eukprot:6213135-Pleurochrysis_carterae.AAC.2
MLASHPNDETETEASCAAWSPTHSFVRGSDRPCVGAAPAHGGQLQHGLRPNRRRASWPRLLRSRTAERAALGHARRGRALRKHARLAAEGALPHAAVRERAQSFLEPRDAAVGLKPLLCPLAHKGAQLPSVRRVHSAHLYTD